MKKTAIILFTLLSVIFSAASKKADKAVMIVHYGTTNDDMRRRALDAINEDVKAAYPDREFIEAYTSPMVIRALEKRGINYPTPLEALMMLRGKGIKDVIIQSTMLMNGSQTEVINLDAAMMSQWFDRLAVGAPLLNTIEDSAFILNLLTKKYPVASKRDAVVFVGHGGDNAGTAIYSQLDTMLGQKEGNYYVATIEGYPDLAYLQKRLKGDKIKNVQLVPLLIVGGNHIKQDIDGEWKQQLQQAGYNVSVTTEALGEDPQFRSWFLSRLASLN